MNESFGFIRTEYSFTSGSGELESARFINEYTIRIFLDQTRERGEQIHQESTEIGRASISLFLLELAYNQNEATFDVFDHCREYVNLYEDLYTDDDELIEPIRKIADIDNGNLLYIRRLDLLPEWRGRGIGRKVLKDIIWRFGGCCGLVIVYAYPIQFAEGITRETDLWTQQLLLSELPQDEVEAHQKLYTFYQSVGFRRVPKRDIHFMSMSLANPVLNQIPLDEAEEL